jgi:aspartate aminotransferase
MLNALPPDLQSLLRAQERFEQIRQRWSRGPARHGADLAYANPYAGPPAEVKEAITSAMQSGRALSLQYTPYGGATIPRRHVAQDLRKKHELPYQWQDVVLTPGAMAGLNIVLRSLVAEGHSRRVLMPVPCWLDYPLYLQQQGLQSVPVSLQEDQHLDLGAIEEALHEDTAAVLLSQPGNPTGISYHEQELRALGVLLEQAEARHGHPILLISDECHRDFVEDASACPSAARFHPHAVMVYSFGKRWFIQGQRIGFVAVSPNMPQREDYRHLLTQLCRAMGFCTPTALMQNALIDLLAVNDDHAWLHQRRKEVARTLQQAGYSCKDPDGTFFLYPRVPEGMSDFAFCEQLAEQGVLVLPAAMFHDQDQVRLSLTDTDAAMNRALPILVQALSS